MFAPRLPASVPMNQHHNQSNKRIRRGHLRWEQSFRLLQIVERNPQITAEELQIEGATIGIEISLRTAFRFLERYRSSNGNIFNYARTHLQIVTEILQATPSGQPLSPFQIKDVALEQGVCLHLSTVYRILHKLVATGAVIQKDNSKQRLYEWRREQSPHARITCVACGQTVEFEKDYLNSLAKNLCSTFDYQHDRLDLTLHAYCPRCQPR